MAINIGKDTDSSLKLSSKTTSGQSSPLIIRGQLTEIHSNTTAETDLICGSLIFLDYCAVLNSQFGTKEFNSNKMICA